MYTRLAWRMSLPYLVACILASSAGCQNAVRVDLGRYLTQIDHHRMASLQYAPQEPAGRYPSANRVQVEDATLHSFSALSIQTSHGNRAMFSLAAYQPVANTIEDDTEVSEEPSSSVRGPLPTFKETLKRDLRRWPGELWQDTKGVYTDPQNILILLGAGGAAVALHQHADDANADFFKDENHFGSETRDTLSFVGSPAVHFAFAGLWYTIGVTRQDDKTYEVGRTLMNALVINGLSTMALKVISDRRSPNGEDLAFPSGHMSSTVTLAAVMHEAYGPLVGIPLYGLSALVAIERLDDKEHYLSDVVFGAAMGWVIGHSVATGHRPELFGGEIVPFVDPENNNTGLAWMKSF